MRMKGIKCIKNHAPKAKDPEVKISNNPRRKASFRK